MKTPTDYRRDLDPYNVKLSIGSVAEAKATIKDLVQSQKALRQIKKEIDLDIKTIRAGYASRMSTAGAGASNVLTIFGQRKAAGSARADAKRKLKAEQDRQIAPYQQVKLTIDDMINQMDRAKIQLQNYITENS